MSRRHWDRHWDGRDYAAVAAARSAACERRIRRAERGNAVKREVDRCVAAVCRDDSDAEEEEVPIDADDAGGTLDDTGSSPWAAGSRSTDATADEAEEGRDEEDDRRDDDAWEEASVRPWRTAWRAAAAREDDGTAIRRDRTNEEDAAAAPSWHGTDRNTGRLLEAWAVPMDRSLAAAALAAHRWHWRYPSPPLQLRYCHRQQCDYRACVASQSRPLEQADIPMLLLPPCLP